MSEPAAPQAEPKGASVLVVRLILFVVLIALIGLLIPRELMKGDPGNQSPRAQHALASSTEVGEVYNQRGELLERGRVVYNRYCAGCHGIDGKGDGPAAERLIVKPRNFLLGAYKFRSTRDFQLPLEEDLHRTITRGLPGVSMPAFPLLPEQEKVALIQYVKSFYTDWEQEAADRQVVATPMPPKDFGADNDLQVKRGRIVYLSMRCWQCHGTDGAGTNAGISVVDTGEKFGAIAPRNFTRARFRGGMTPRDIYRTIHTGLHGAMPAYGGNPDPGQNQILVAMQQVLPTMTDYMDPGELETLKDAAKTFPMDYNEIMGWSDQEKRERVERNTWDLVAYILSLRQGGGKPTAKIVTPTPGEQPTKDGNAKDDKGEEPCPFD